MKKLTQQEEAVMQVMWRMNMGAVRDVLGQMPEPKPPYTTVASIVKNLEQKGFLSSRKFGNTNVYSTIVSQDQYKSGFMSQFVNRYFGDSFKSMVSFFAEEEKISADELKEIINLIEEGGEK